MRVDVKCPRSFAELWAFPERSVDNNRYIQLNALTAPLPQPSFLADELGYTKSRYALPRLSRYKCGIAVPIKQIHRTLTFGAVGIELNPLFLSPAI
jgi:hypothetical protein